MGLADVEVRPGVFELVFERESLLVGDIGLEDGFVRAGRVLDFQFLFVFGNVDDVVAASLAGPLPDDRRVLIDANRGRIELVAVVSGPDIDRDLVLARQVLGLFVIFDVFEPVAVIRLFGIVLGGCGGAENLPVRYSSRRV